MDYSVISADILGKPVVNWTSITPAWFKSGVSLMYPAIKSFLLVVLMFPCFMGKSFSYGPVTQWCIIMGSVKITFFPLLSVRTSTCCFFFFQCPCHTDLTNAWGEHRCLTMFNEITGEWWISHPPLTLKPLGLKSKFHVTVTLPLLEEYG